MKKRALVILVALALILAIPANAAQGRTANVIPGLSFSGTTATCTVLVSGDYSTDEIFLVVELWQESSVVDTWNEEGEGYINFSETAKVSKDKSYTLKVYPVINGQELSMASITKTCS